MTIKQRQCLLFYLGYYTGSINGKWDSKCTAATKAFQKDFGGLVVDGICGTQTEKSLTHAVAYGMPAKKADSATGDFWDGIKHFKRSEFKCKCGKYCDGFPVEPSEKLVELLETIRDHFNAPVTVASGVRCKTHNTNVGGASASQHLYGTAADIKVKGKTPKEVAAYCQTLLPNSGGIGLYNTWVHVDVRSNKARWNG